MRYLVSLVCVLALGVMPLVGCSGEETTGGTGGVGGVGGNGGMGGVTPACAPAEDECTNSVSDPIEEICAAVVPEQEGACTGVEPLLNPSSCTGSGNVVTHKLTTLRVAPNCSTGFDLDGCDGNSCDPGGLAAPDGVSGVDNGVGAMGPTLDELGWNLGDMDQSFHEAICSGVFDIELEIEPVPDEGCAVVTIVSASVAADPIAMNLSDSGCVSGSVGAFPVRVGEVQGFMENAVVRMTVSSRGVSDGLLGGTIELPTAAELFDEVYPPGPKFSLGTVAGQFADINADLSWSSKAFCDSISVTLELGGQAVCEECDVGAVEVQP